MFACVRDADASGRAFVALNFAERGAAIAAPPAGAGRAWRVALSTHPRAAEELPAERVTLAPLEALIAVEA